ncbi:Outer membrane porin protein [Caballeronia sp. SBC1]|uniref:porin n=1 Tax=unclassified Caballeronia TaxID=2646786 RepID=UPI0013E1DF06|nr:MULTISPECIES: porin [unclassified Caballeronia]QIE23037.1 Outer membrane porin protein [Caballeronia sp. SBC2]QIN60932.1 Outer membrane porin protein [Caballeronia sp. SBC1]
MKKTLMVAALSGVFATAAHAQSSVTLYGLIDAGLTYTNNQNGSHNFKMTSGAVNGSRWGLRGSEDLGGGLKAIFTLENGFSIANGTLGQNGREFGRQAFVGLSSNQYGAVTLGRQYDSVVDYLGPLALTGTQYGGTQFAHPFDNDNLDNSFRINNSVKYTSANYAGFKFGAQYGFSNQAAGFSNNRAYSVGASYNYGPLNIAAAYLQLNNDLTAGVINNTGGAVASDNTFNAGLQRTFGAGLNYAFGPATVGFVFTQTKLEDAASINGATVGNSNNIAIGNYARFNNYELNAHYALTPALSLAGAYTYTDARLDGEKPSFHQFSVQTAYSLSKRTDVYLQGEYVHALDLGDSGIGAPINGVGMSSTPNQVSATVGIRHRF